jgi:hypothetical protein
MKSSLPGRYDFWPYGCMLLGSAIIPSIDTLHYFTIFKPFSFQDSKPPSISMTE